MRHPDESSIALYAGGDLGFLDKFRVRSHLRTCTECQGRVTAYLEARERLRQESEEMPPGLDWERLAAEMTGNIRVGLAAGECVASVSPRSRQFAWRPALAVSGLAMVLLAGWWLNFPVDQRDTLARGVERLWKRDARIPIDTSIYLESNRAGIQLKENGSAMTLMHPNSVPTVVSVSMQGSMRARYVDSDTGQVTITNVYAQ